jgi:hypothetical protein
MEGLGIRLSPAVFKTANLSGFCGFDSHSLRTNFEKNRRPAILRGDFYCRGVSLTPRDQDRQQSLDPLPLNTHPQLVAVLPSTAQHLMD